MSVRNTFSLDKFRSAKGKTTWPITSWRDEASNDRKVSQSVCNSSSLKDNCCAKTGLEKFPEKGFTFVLVFIDGVWKLKDISKVTSLGFLRQRNKLKCLLQVQHGYCSSNKPVVSFLCFVFELTSRTMKLRALTISQNWPVRPVILKMK